MKKLLYILILIPILITSCDVYPEAFFFTDKVVAEIDEDIFFTNESYNARDHEWDFGDGYLSNDINVVHRYAEPGEYQVTLTVWSKSGHTDVSYQTVQVIAPAVLQIEVREYWDEYLVVGASVILYPTLKDWDSETNMIVEEFTNQNGIALFSTDIWTKRYYVDVWETEHNNYTLRD